MNGTPPSPVRSQITEVIADCLAAVTRANGYTSDAGQSVYIGRGQGYLSEAPALYLLPGIERREAGYGTHIATPEYQITCLVDGSDYPDSPDYILIDALAADLCHVFSTLGPALDGLAAGLTLTNLRPGYPEEAGNTIGCSLSFTLQYQVSLSDPYTALAP